MSLLESTRAFAFGQAEKAGEANRLRLAHAAYYRKAAETEFRVEETPNYRTALESYFDVGSDPADSINFLWSTRTYGSYTSGRSAFVPPVEALLERELPALEAARAHQFLAAMCEKLDPARGERHAKRSMELFDSCGDRVGWAWAAWCFALARQDFTSQPEALLREALATAVEARERYLESHLLSMLAIAAAERGDNEEALDLLVRAERACDPADVATLSMIWSNTALVHVQRNDYDRAAELMKQCVASLEESIPWGARFQLVNLGLVHLLRRDYLSARDALRRGVDYLRTYPGLLPMAMMFDVIALLAARTGSYEPAVKLASFAQTAFDGGFKRQPIDQGYFDEMLAELHRRVDDGSFVRLWDDGRSMTFEHAAALAETI
jgi:tetratricopeptide (TPR) repeat protein